MSLFLVTEGQRKLWVAYIDDLDEYGRVYAFVQNTGMFHLNEGLAADFYADRDLGWAQIDVERAKIEIESGVGRLATHKKADLLSRVK